MESSPNNDEYSDVINIQTELELQSIFSCLDNQQQVNGFEPQHHKQLERSLTNPESQIIEIIDNCLRNWYKPWIDKFLAGGREFRVVYDLMEGLFHYELQILSSSQELSLERTNAIAQAVARLIDYGNAILNLDLIIRNNDATSSEMDSSKVTTIKLFRAHLKANNLRRKLLYDYFRKDKPPIYNYDSTGSQDDQDFRSRSPINPNSNNLLQPPNFGDNQTVISSKHLSPPSATERSHRSSLGSMSSLNSVSDGKRTPQNRSISPSTLLMIPQYEHHRASIPHSSSSQIATNNNNSDSGGANNYYSENMEIFHMVTIIKSEAFSDPENFKNRATLLPKILTKLENLLSSYVKVEKLSGCFELLDALLDSIEKLPVETRTSEVGMIAKVLLKPIVRKIYIDDRDSLLEFQQAHWITCLTSIIRLMSSADFGNYLKNFQSIANIAAFLKDYLFIIKRFMSTSKIVAGHQHQQQRRKSFSSPSNLEPQIDKSSKSSRTFPACWVEMNLLVCSTLLNSLTYLYQILRQHFNLNLQIWLNYIDCLLHFILQDSLKPDKTMLRTHQRQMANDIIQTSSEYVWISWDSLSVDQKQQSLDELIEPLLEACMILRSKQRLILLPIFYDMMRCDYTSQYVTPRDSIYGGSIISTTSTTFSSSTLNGDEEENETGVGSERLNLILPEISQPISNGYVEHEQLEKLMGSSSNNNRLKPNVNKVVRPTFDELQLPYLNFRHETGPKIEDGTVLTKFTHIIVGKLNNLMIELNLGDELFKDELCKTIAGELVSSNLDYRTRNLFHNSSDSYQFKSMTKHTADLIAEFMQICLDYHEADRLTYRHLYLLTIFKLILFFRDKVDEIELYLHYLFKLFVLHHTSGRYVEAGYTLLEFAKTLPFTEQPVESHHRIVFKLFRFQTSTIDYLNLKTFLYDTIMEYFNLGQLWEAAVPLGRELIDIYQFRTYEYDKLAQILQKLSTYFNSIISAGSNRNRPEYFKVSFYGNGFPNCLKNATMIYRGKAFEKLADFYATILSKFPDAKILNSLSKPDDSILMEPGGRYLQINSCSPVTDLQSKFKAKPIKKLDESLLVYYKYNECDKFHYSRRIEKPAGVWGNSNDSKQANNDSGDNFANLWREKTTLSTNTLPGLLPFFPVYLIESNVVTPIESAIEDLERINDRLSNMVNRFKADKHKVEDVRLLGQLLLGVVDAAVNGGITKYEEAFFQSATKTTLASTIANSKSTLETNFDSLCAISGGNSALGDQAMAAEIETTHQFNNGAENNNKHQEQVQNTGHQRNHRQQQHQAIHATMEQHEAHYSVAQVDRLKCLIASQVPLLDDAIRLHRERVAEIMRPQHEHLEESYKKLRVHILKKYAKYLPHDYQRSSGNSSSLSITSTLRSYRSLARSPNRTPKSEPTYLI